MQQNSSIYPRMDHIFLNRPQFWITGHAGARGDRADPSQEAKRAKGLASVERSAKRSEDFRDQYLRLAMRSAV
jgi:hypothetical protein